MKHRLVVVTLFAAMTAGVVASSAPSSTLAAPRTPAHPAVFDKTRFVFHLGLAYFAFHHFVYNPYRAGAFKKGAPHRTGRIIKAGVALLVTYHELKKAYDIAKGSNSRTLQALVKPLNGLVGRASHVADRLRGGQYDNTEVTGLVTSANGFSRQATSNGISIKDVPVPGLGS
ncbi:MAG: hypothetical protein NVS2B16_23730 [Chloroflexota bacterium]